MKTKVHSHPFTRKEWSVVKGSLFERLLFKLTFGKLGRLEYLTFKEEKMHRYFVGYSEYQYPAPCFSLESNVPPRPFVNCRCSMVNL